MQVWIDTDMGADDLFAILIAVQHAEVAGLSLSFGCTTLPQAARNAAGAAQTFGWRMPITLGAARPLLGPTETAARILGPTGMLARGPRLPQAEAAYPAAPPALAAWMARGGAVLALGPLTTLAATVLAFPEAAPQRLIWMGGSTGRGNHTAFAEFNALADPLALAVLLDRGVQIDMIDLEACRQVQIGPADVDRLASRAGAQAALLASLLGGYLDIALSRGRPSMALYDPVAAVALVQPDLMDFSPVRLEVDITAADTRGQTRVSPGPANARVARRLDAAAIRDTALAGLEAACQTPT